jgi:large subunit ribosomal protein L29
VGEPWVPHVMKARELRDMTDDELEDALHDRRQELFNLRFQSATGALENSARLKFTKREIARILTVTTERAANAEKR